MIRNTRPCPAKLGATNRATRKSRLEGTKYENRYKEWIGDQGELDRQEDEEGSTGGREEWDRPRCRTAG